MQLVLDRLESDGYKMDRLNAKDRTASEEQDLVERLHRMDPSLNGNAEHLAEDLALYKQEIGSKKKWNLWGKVKEIPGKTWNFIKTHKKTSIVVGIGLLIAAAYFSGVGGIVLDRVRAWMLANGYDNLVERAGQMANKAKDAVKGAKDALGEAFKKAPIPEPGPVTPSPVPPVTPPAPSPNLPDFLDGVDKVTRPTP